MPSYNGETARDLNTLAQTILVDTEATNHKIDVIIQLLKTYL